MNRIKQLRLERGLKQSELAKYLNIAQNTLSYWESGKNDVDNKSLKNLAKFFSVTTDYLLGLSDNPHQFEKNYIPTLEETIKNAQELDEAAKVFMLFCLNFAKKRDKFDNEIATEPLPLYANGRRASV